MHIYYIETLENSIYIYMYMYMNVYNYIQKDERKYNYHISALTFAYAIHWSSDSTWAQLSNIWIICAPHSTWKHAYSAKASENLSNSAVDNVGSSMHNRFILVHSLEWPPSTA